MLSRLTRRRLCVACGVVALAMSCAVARADGPLSGLDAIRVPAGFVVEQVAGPPLVERPMLASFDDRGRLYVCDSAGVNLRGPELAKNPPHKIRLLEDTDGDGRFDTSQVFADKMLFPQGIVWHDGAIYCASPPSFWKLTDTDGDDVADVREELVTGFANTGVADDMHGGSLGPDGRIYWCCGRFPHRIRRPGGEVVHEGSAPLVLRCRPDGSDLEVVCGSQGNAVGVAFTPQGDMFASGTFFAPDSMGAGLRDAVIHCVDGGEYPVRGRDLHEHKRTGDLLPPLTHLGVSASSDLLLCRAGQLGEASRGDLFSAQFNLHKVLRHRIMRAGASFTCRNEDFLVSADTDFHPTDVLEDADGSLLVVNTGGWFRIGCPTSQVARPEVLGAIYRVRSAQGDKPSDPRGGKLDWSTPSIDALARRLADERFAVRDRATAQLARHGESAAPALAAVLSSDAETETKCAAIWALTRIDHEAARTAVRQALGDREAGVRQAAARSAGLHEDAQATTRLAEMVAADEPAVRREAATALGRSGDAAAVPALLAAMEATQGDRFLEHAVIFALIRIDNPPATAKGLELAQPAARRGALVALDQMDGGGLSPEAVTPFLSAADPLLQQSALWVIAHHADWGRNMVGFFDNWLDAPDLNDSRREELKRQLLAFASDQSVQELIGRTLADSSTPRSTQLLLLEVISQSAVDRLPTPWIAGLQKSLADPHDAIVGQAVIALRSLHLDKRPLVTKIDPNVDLPPTLTNFDGTSLAEDFCVRWQGMVRCPADGVYLFATESDDGSQLFIDDKLVVDNGGDHGLREKRGQAKLAAGDHQLRLEFVQGKEDAACRLMWSYQGHGQEVVPADALFHRSSDSERLESGLVAEFYQRGGSVETFPDPAASAFDELLLQVAADSNRSDALRAQAAAAVVGHLTSIDPPLFGFLLASTDEYHGPLLRMDAADALAAAPLDDEQLLTLCDAIATAGVLEVPRLVQAFAAGNSDRVGLALVAALNQSPGLKSLAPETLAGVLSGYSDAVRDGAEPLFEQLRVDLEQQQARLVELEGALAGGDVQRGRELFFANQKAICATCHTVQGKGGKIGPDLSKIGAIRTPRDLLEAIVLPSASFARGYEPFHVVTDSGQVFSGIIAREAADTLFLVGSNRLEVRLPREAVESMAQSHTSIMPEGMEKQLSGQELADLIEFLGSLR